MGLGKEVREKIGREIAKITIDKEQCDSFRGELDDMKSGYLRESIQIRQYFGVREFDKWINTIQDICKIPQKEKGLIEVGFKHCKSDEAKHFNIKFENNELVVTMMYFALCKHPDGLVDIIYAMYVVEDMRRVSYVETKLLTRKLGGFYSKEKTVLVSDLDSPTSSKFRALKSHPGCDHYFRLKAVEAFLAEGLVERKRLKHVEGIREYKVLHVEPYSDELRERCQSYRFLQDAISSIEYNTDLASKFKEKIEKYKTSSWNEDIILRKYLEIDDFSAFIKEIAPLLELDEKNILEMECMHKYASVGQVNKMEFSYDREGLCTRYLFFALSKHSCNSKSDFVFAQYELTAKKFYSLKETDSPRSLFWGALKYKRTRKVKIAIDCNNFEDLKNDPNKYDYCRKRVLDECIASQVVKLPEDKTPIVVHF